MRTAALLCNGLRGEKQNRGMSRPHEAIGGAKGWVYIHVSWKPSSCGLTLLPPCPVISALSRNFPPSLPPTRLVSYQTDWFVHMDFCIPPSSLFCPLFLCLLLSLPFSRSITLMLCGSVGCCVYSCMGAWNNLLAHTLSFPLSFSIPLLSHPSFIVCCFFFFCLSQPFQIYRRVITWGSFHNISIYFGAESGRDQTL